MLQVEYSSVVDVLKTVLKNKGFTYNTLAEGMGVSEVTIKRVFSPKEGQYSQRLFEICEHLDISLFDVVDLAKSSCAKKFRLNKEQEEYFTDNISELALFREIYRKRPLNQIKEKWNLSQKELFSKLLIFEKLKLIEVLPGDEVKVLPTGTLDIGLNSPLEIKLRTVLTDRFIASFHGHIDERETVFLNSELEMAPATFKNMMKEIREVSLRYCQISFRDKSLLPQEKLQSIRWCFAMTPYATPWETVGKVSNLQ